MKRLAAFSLLLSALFLSGCASLSDPDSMAISSVRVAANTGTQLALQQNPDWRPQFENATAKLGTLLDRGSLDFEQLRDILLELPIRELKSDEAVIIISNAELLFDDYVRRHTRLDQIAAAPVIGRAIHNGLTKALAAK